MLDVGLGRVEKRRKRLASVLIPFNPSRESAGDFGELIDSVLIMTKENEIRQALAKGVPVTVNGRKITTAPYNITGDVLVVEVNTGRGKAYNYASLVDIDNAIIDPSTVEMNRVFDRIETLLERSAK